MMEKDFIIIIILIYLLKRQYLFKTQISSGGIIPKCKTTLKMSLVNVTLLWSRGE